MQQCLSHNAQRKFFDELNKILLDGWRVVPGTMTFATMDLAADGTVPACYVLPNGKFVKQLFAVIVERDDPN